MQTATKFHLGTSLPKMPTICGKRNEDNNMEELDRLESRGSWRTFAPAAMVFIGAFIMLGIRIKIGPTFVSDGALMMLALACYILAALFQLTNLYAPSS